MKKIKMKIRNNKIERNEQTNVFLNIRKLKLLPATQANLEVKVDPTLVMKLVAL